MIPPVAISRFTMKSPMWCMAVERYGKRSTLVTDWSLCVQAVSTVCVPFGGRQEYTAVTGALTSGYTTSGKI